MYQRNTKDDRHNINYSECKLKVKKRNSCNISFVFKHCLFYILGCNTYVVVIFIEVHFLFRSNGIIKLVLFC